MKMTNGETQRKDNGNTYTNEWCDDKTKTMTNTKNKNTIRIIPMIRQTLLSTLRPIIRPIVKLGRLCVVCANIVTRV